MLVEDDEHVRTLAVAIPRRNGYRVPQAAMGGDAELICEQYRSAARFLLTDVVKPRKSGRQRWERLAPLRPTMKVLVMSGYTDDASVHQGALGIELAIIQKPLMLGLLLAKVRAVPDENGRWWARPPLSGFRPVTEVSRRR